MSSRFRLLAFGRTHSTTHSLLSLADRERWTLDETTLAAEALRLLRLRGHQVLVFNDTGEGDDCERLLEQALRMRPSLHTVAALDRPVTARLIRWSRLGVDDCLWDGSCEETLRVLRGIEVAAEDAVRPLDGPEDAFTELAGESRPMRAVVDVLRLVAPRRSTVLIGGATGTGKELAARALHACSKRAGRPMVMVNCGAIPAALVESELFGHEKGSFTGAAERRIGCFERAHGGTIFLDEVGELPLAMQAKLLRALQEGEVQRVGGSQTIAVDVRIVAATNRDLARMVEEGRFREDLYYRLNVVPVRMPSLAERASDIPILVDRLLGRICRAEGLTPRRMSPEAMRHLCEASWPGNVRQLENALAKAVALSADRRMLLPSDFSIAATPLSAAASCGVEPRLPPEGLNYDLAVARFERSLLSQALELAAGNKKRAADLLRVKRTTFAARWKSLGGGTESRSAAQGVSV